MNILLADDRKDLRSALRLALAWRHPGWRFCEAANPAGLMAALSESCPDLLLLDWDGGGWEVTLPEVRRLCPSVKVVALSGRPDQQTAALRAGAGAFVCKADPIESLEQALQSVLIS